MGWALQVGLYPTKSREGRGLPLRFSMMNMGTGQGDDGTW